MQLRNRRVFQKLKIWSVRTVGPGALWLLVQLDYPVSMGGYEYPTRSGRSPVLLHMTGNAPQARHAPARGREGRPPGAVQDPFADIERSIRDLLGALAGAGGFDSARDIQAITVNRWAHGYTFEYVWPWDKAFYPDGPLPGEVASRPFGRITFAGTDRSSRAYIDSAIDAAYAAVNDLLSRM